MQCHILNEFIYIESHSILHIRTMTFKLWKHIICHSIRIIYFHMKSFWELMFLKFKWQLSRGITLFVPNESDCTFSWIQRICLKFAKIVFLRFQKLFYSVFLFYFSEIICCWSSEETTRCAITLTYRQFVPHRCYSLSQLINTHTAMFCTWRSN